MVLVVFLEEECKTRQTFTCWSGMVSVVAPSSEWATSIFGSSLQPSIRFDFPIAHPTEEVELLFSDTLGNMFSFFKNRDGNLVVWDSCWLHLCCQSPMKRMSHTLAGCMLEDDVSGETNRQSLCLRASRASALGCADTAGLCHGMVGTLL